MEHSDQSCRSARVLGLGVVLLNLMGREKMKDIQIINRQELLVVNQMVCEVCASRRRKD